jgi:hypothetical protein
MNQLNHKYKLTISYPIKFKTVPQRIFSTIPPVTSDIAGIPNSIPLNTTTDVRSEENDVHNGRGVVLTNHHIEFDIKFTTDGDGSNNPSSILIYNISPTTRKFLENSAGDKPEIMLEAGWETDKTIPIIFSGEVIGVSERKINGVTRVTELLLGSGTVASKEARTSRSYQANTSLETVIKDLVKDMNIQQGIFDLGTTVATITRPLAHVGHTKDFLTKLCKDNKLKLFIQNNTINIIPEKIEYAGQYVFNLSTESNLLSVDVDSNDTLSENESGTRKALSVVTTLNGAYTLGSNVVVDSLYHKGVYSITEIQHQGSYEGGSWSSSLKLIPVDGYEIRGVE